MTSTVQKNLPGGLVLNTEKMTMKLNKHVIVTNEAINRKKVLANVWNMKNIV